MPQVHPAGRVKEQFGDQNLRSIPVEIVTILVPAFVHKHLNKSRCDKCEASLEDAWIHSAGVRLSGENQACFFATVWCTGCEDQKEFLFQSRPFTVEEWWREVGCWVGDAASPSQIHNVLGHLKTLPIPLLLRERAKVIRLDLVGGYAGDVGPVILLYRRKNLTKPYGVVRLERYDRLNFLAKGADEALPISRWLWFSSLPPDSSFCHKRQHWKKLSLDRLREIVLDRVFERWLGRGNRGK